MQTDFRFEGDKAWYLSVYGLKCPKRLVEVRLSHPL